MSKHDGRPIAIIFCYNDAYVPIAQITLPILKRYAALRNYVLHGGFNFYKEDPTNLRDYGDRGKLDMFCQLYDDFEMVMFLDIDALVMNSAICIEDVLGNRPFIWSHTPDGPASGFWIARCTPQVRHTLTTVQRLAQQKGAVVAKENLGPPHSVTLSFEPRGTSDQTTMTGLMHTPPFSDVLGHCVPGKQVGHCVDDAARYGWAGMESQIQYEPGDFLLTAPALPIAERVEVLRHYATRTA